MCALTGELAVLYHPKPARGFRKIPPAPAKRHQNPFVTNAEAKFALRTTRMSSQRPFVAIDFETADTGFDSACAVALVRVADGRVVEKAHSLIRPPRKLFAFTRIHGIAWHHVADKPTFREVWPQMSEILRDAEFLVAHNAGFDRAVLTACCRGAGFAAPALPFQCTMVLARRTWGIRPTRLPNVCALLGIPLVHHDPRSDAEAAATILLRAQNVNYHSAG
jgi:DNA polymerase-3 subunit epsilon